jgi:hypothetical protein
MQYERRCTICNLLARHLDSTSASLPTRRHNAKINCRSIGRILAAAAANPQPTSAAARIPRLVP